MRESIENNAEEGLRDRKKRNILTVLTVLLQLTTAGLYFRQLCTAEWTGLQILYHTAVLLSEAAFLMTVLIGMNLKRKKELPVLRILLLSVFCFGMTELLYADMFHMDHAWSAVLNLMIYAVPYALLYAVFSGRRSHYSYLIATVFWLIFAMVNHYYFEFRSQAMELSDLSMAGTAKNVMGQYHLELSPDVWFVYLSFALLVLVLFCRKKGALPGSRKKRAAALLAGLALILTVACNLPKVNLWNTNIGTRHHGYALSYLSFAKRHFENPVPKGYSAKEAEAILEEYNTQGEPDPQEISPEEASGTQGLQEQQGTQSLSGEEPVDVIVVMNEAFSDLPTVYGFETSQDGLPFIHSLQGKNVKKGWMLSSVFGGTTADTEYEFLTGNSVSFLTADAVPYTQYLNSDQESLARLLKNQGYSATAFHPYLESGYKRYKVYPLLGFDDFISIEDDLPYVGKIRNYISDASDYQDLEQIYEEKKQDGPVFLFNVTMQNHGSYHTDEPAVRVTVKPTDGELDSAQLEEYLSLAYQSDRAFSQLVEYFSQSDRRTILLMFGDHQPGLDDDVLKALEPKMYEENASLEEREKKYTVPYILWANFDLPEEPAAPEYISPGFLRSFLLENAGLELSAYDRFVSSVRQQYPAINVLGYLTQDGKMHELSGAFDEKLLNDYRKIAYYNLFDHKKVKMELFTEPAGKEK